ncbi:MAG: hypothetical protein KDA60_17300 [Planctomycetales bacterium]|nr:hypothetical protein [Planctomycetales bacterium]
MSHYLRDIVWRGSVFLACFAGGLALSADEPATVTPPATGTIRGKVVYVANTQKPWRLGRYYIRNAKSGEIAEAVVALADRQLASHDTDRVARTVAIDQKNFQFVPEVVAIHAGDHVRFLNNDTHTHNVKTSHPKHSFNVTMPIGGEHIETFDQATGTRQPYKIDCVFHSSMRAWVFAFDHPWFAVTGKDGAFELVGIPPGEYQLEVAHAAGDL